MKTTICVSWKYDGEHEASMTKLLMDPFAAVLFLDGFIEGRMSSGNHTGFKVEINYEPDEVNK